MLTYNDMKKEITLLLIIVLGLSNLNANAQIDALIINRSVGELIEAESPEDRDKISILFSAEAVDLINQDELEASFEWDFNNDGEIDATGQEVTQEFDFESINDEFSFGFPVKLIATDNRDDTQLEKTILIKPSLSSAPVLTLQPGSFSFFNDLFESIDELNFNLEYFSRANEDNSKNLKVKLIARVEDEYKRFVKIKGKTKARNSFIKSPNFDINKKKLRETFPNFSDIEIPVYVVDALSGFSARHLVNVNLNNVGSFIKDENLVNVAELDTESDDNIGAAQIEQRMRTVVIPAGVDGTFPIFLTKFQDTNGITRIPDALTFELDENNQSLKVNPVVIVTKDDIGGGQLGTFICSTEVFKGNGLPICNIPQVNMTPNVMIRAFNGKNTKNARIHINALYF